MKALIFIAHGSKREAPNLEFKTMVSQPRVSLTDSFTKIEATFLEFAKPGIDETIHAMIQTGITEIQIYPFFLNSGKHVHHDIPEKVREAKELYPEVDFELLPHFGSSVHILTAITSDLKRC